MSSYESALAIEAHRILLLPLTKSSVAHLRRVSTHITLLFLFSGILLYMKTNYRTISVNFFKFCHIPLN